MSHFQRSELLQSFFIGLIRPVLIYFAFQGFFTKGTLSHTPGKSLVFWTRSPSAPEQNDSLTCLLTQNGIMSFYLNKIKKCHRASKGDKVLLCSILEYSRSAYDSIEKHCTKSSWLDILDNIHGCRQN